MGCPDVLQCSVTLVKLNLLNGGEVWYFRTKEHIVIFTRADEAYYFDVSFKIPLQDDQNTIRESYCFLCVTNM